MRSDRSYALVVVCLALAIAGCELAGARSQADFEREFGRRQVLNDWKRSDEAEPIWAAHEARVRAALQTPASAEAPEWAGEYYEGDGLGHNVSLLVAPGVGFSYVRTGCLGVYDRNWGDVSVNGDGSLKLTCMWPNAEGVFSVPASLVPLTWGERHYLVAPEQFGEFVFRIEGGREPRDDIHGRHLIRRGDEERPVTGRPQVPTAFAGWFPSMPIEATVVQVHPKSRRKVGYDETTVIPVTLSRHMGVGLGRRASGHGGAGSS